MYNYHFNTHYPDEKDKELLEYFKDKTIKDISFLKGDLIITLSNGVKLIAGAFASERPYCEPEGILTIDVSSKKKINKREW